MADVMVMTAAELLDELLRLQSERSDFAELDIYVEVVDRQSYDKEQGASAVDGITEYTSNVLGEGSAYSFQVHTPVDIGGKRGGDYVLICAVEL